LDKKVECIQEQEAIHVLDICMSSHEAFLYPVYSIATVNHIIITRPGR